MRLLPFVRLLCLAQTPLAAQRASVPIPDYARAERMRSWRLQKAVVNDWVEPHWLSDGSRFWYRASRAKGDEILLVDPVANSITPVAEPPASEPASATAPAAYVRSPDSKWEAFAFAYNLYLRPAGGGDSVAITTDGVRYYSYAVGEPSVANLRFGAPPRPSITWSPDSRKIAVQRID